MKQSNFGCTWSVKVFFLRVHNSSMSLWYFSCLNDLLWFENLFVSLVPVMVFVTVVVLTRRYGCFVYDGAENLNLHAVIEFIHYVESITEKT